jgi:hypothetical protein
MTVPRDSHSELVQEQEDKVNGEPPLVEGLRRDWKDVVVTVVRTVQTGLPLGLLLILAHVQRGAGARTV